MQATETWEQTGKMLPPIEDAVLQNNPDFASLYKTLTTVVLNPDGTTRNHPQAKERRTAQEKIKAVRLEEAKKHLLVQAISTAAPSPNQASENPRPAIAVRRGGRAAARPALAAGPSASELPAELADLLLLLPPLLRLEESGVSPDGKLLSHDNDTDTEGGGGGDEAALRLLLSSPPFTSLPQHLPRLALLVSERLQAAAQGLARITRPVTNPSFVHRAVPALPADAVALKQAIADAQARLVAARQAVATAVVAALEQHAAALAALLRSLEAKHGPVARSLELRAAEVALSSQARAADAQSARDQAQRLVYAPSAAAALRRYADHLRDSRLRLDEAIRQRTALLQEYGVSVDDEDDDDDDDDNDDTEDDDDDDDDAKRNGDPQMEKAMREMARVYREMGKQMQDVQDDLARLDHA